ncbi:magnesium transporter MgtE N-terminal domain-containing protein [Sporolactobacillus vineae]|uniref:magnesium transporter MgtE N-terminal domain-containing protein n=1 Tax=Sporolactobacillus vineae TaxID=444463 RepID=UPI000289115D|nr:CBS domain-containing protein [Sporolactobacillus vineae]
MISKFYFSRILGRPVYQSKVHHMLGRIADLYVDTDYKRPKVVAIKLRGGVTLDSTAVAIELNGSKYNFYCRRLRGKDVAGKENYFSLKETMLDKQIIDLDGRKVVRVNDLRFAVVSEGLFLIAVDIGLEGLLRRLDVAKPMKNVLQLFHKNLPGQLILWDDVQTVESGENVLKLAAQAKKISMLHPSDVADIIEDLDKDKQMSMFTALDEEKAADVLEEMEPESQVTLIDNLSITKAANVLEKMPSDEVADIFGILDQDIVHNLLKVMNKETSREVQELMEYPENTVGSLMSTDLVSINEQMTVEDCLVRLRREKPELDTVYFLYVVNAAHRLTGIVSLRDLAVSEPTVRIHDMMNTDFHVVRDNDTLPDLIQIISKYNLPAVAVVDKTDKLSGTVIATDVLYDLLHKH